MTAPVTAIPWDPRQSLNLAGATNHPNPVLPRPRNNRSTLAIEGKPAMQFSEQETAIAYSAADDTVQIWTCIPADVRALRKDDRFTETKSGTYNDGTDWAQFEIPRKRWSTPRGARTTRAMTDEQRAAAADRLRNARKAG